MLEKSNLPLTNSREETYIQAYETSNALLEVAIAIALGLLLVCTRKGRQELAKFLAKLARP